VCNTNVDTEICIKKNFKGGHPISAFTHYACVDAFCKLLYFTNKHRHRIGRVKLGVQER